MAANVRKPWKNRGKNIRSDVEIFQNLWVFFSFQSPPKNFSDSLWTCWWHLEGCVILTLSNDTKIINLWHVLGGQIWVFGENFKNREGNVKHWTYCKFRRFLRKNYVLPRRFGCTCLTVPIQSALCLPTLIKCFEYTNHGCWTIKKFSTTPQSLKASSDLLNFAQFCLWKGTPGGDQLEF